MLIQTQKGKNFSRKAGFEISKLEYHLQHTIPELFSAKSMTNNSSQVLPRLQKKQKGKLSYQHLTFSVEGVGSLDQEAILEAAKKLYYTKDSVKINSLAFSRKRTHGLALLPVQGQFKQIIELALVDNNKQVKTKQPQIEISGTAKGKDGEVQNIQPKSILSIPLNDFQLFVVHHCDGDGMRWEQFIEKYHFLDENAGGQINSKIHYSFLFSYQEEQGWLSMLSQKNSLYDKFLSEYLQVQGKTLKNLQKLQGFLLLSKERVDKKMKELSDASFQEIHKRWLRLPSQYYKQYTSLKKHIMGYYNSIHQKKIHSDIFLNNMICRYMFAKEYNYKEAMEGVLQYLKWQKNLAASYNLLMFEHFHKNDFFSYLGQDFQGRAVVLNRASHLNFQQIQDSENYCHYYIYFLQIWVQKKLKGYADQYTVLADLQGLGTEHFKLAITQRNIADSLKYSPERQYKLLVVNAGSFPKLIWRVLKPMLPKKTLQKINIIGSDKQEIIQQLSKEMDISVIPEQMGGQNKRNCMDDLEDQRNMLQEEVQGHQ